jgi:hypothetical protein
LVNESYSFIKKKKKTNKVLGGCERETTSKRGRENGLFWSKPCVKTSKCGREKEMLQQENKEEEKRNLGVEEREREKRV